MVTKSRMISFITLIAVLMTYIDTVSAGRDYCMEGSDAICLKFGDFCCAKITATKDGYTDTYHACASSKGIQESGGKFNGGGWSGTWTCTFATSLQASKALFITIISLVSFYCSW